MKRSRAVLFLFAATLFLFYDSIHGKAQSGVHAGTDVSANKKAEEQYKNIQVLKGVPADQIIPGMQFIAASLGVDCEFCHVHDAFDKDDKKPKPIARKMMTMMFAINKDNFNGQREVTCFSCHRGRTSPGSTPMVLGENANSMPPAEAKQTEVLSPSAPSADQLFDKYVQAVGGASAIEKIKSQVMSGTIAFANRNVPIDIYAKDPEKRISFTRTAGGDTVSAFNGHEGWLSSPGRPPREMQGQELEAASMDADLHLALHLREVFQQAKLEKEENIGDVETYVVIGSREGKTPVQLYFDKTSGLLLRLVRYYESPLGRLPTEIDYADYRDAGGVRTPFRWTVARTNGRFTIQLNQVKTNVPVDDERFEKPAPTQAR